MAGEKRCLCQQMSWIRAGGEGLWGLPGGGKGLQLQEEMSEGLFVASLEALTTKAALGTLPQGSGGTRTRWNDPEAVVAKQKQLQHTAMLG